MSAIRVAAAGSGFGRDLEACFERIGAILEEARAAGARLVVLPEASLGGYIADLVEVDAGALPPPLDPDGPEIRRLIALAGPTVVCAGYRERASSGAGSHNSAVCVSGDGVLGRHRKVHQPLGEGGAYGPGDSFDAFDTPLGRMGMVICYDKAFPEAARTLALDGATVVACLSAWPRSRTNPARRIDQDRQATLFDLYDRARAAENQLFWVSANQCGDFGRLRFLGRSKVVGPGGQVLARTGARPGIAIADVDVAESVARARRSMFHLRDRRPDAYGEASWRDRAAG
jgi:N-carbamoylputrescine amidase